MKWKKFKWTVVEWNGNRFRARFILYIYICTILSGRTNFVLSSYTVNSSDINNTRWTNETRSRIQNMATSSSKSNTNNTNTAAPNKSHTWTRTHTHGHSANIDRKYTEHAGFECCCVTFFCLCFWTNRTKNYRPLPVLETLFYSDYFVSSQYLRIHTSIHTWTHTRTRAIGHTIDSRTYEPTNTNIVRKWLKDRCVFSSLFLGFFFSRLRQEICRRRTTIAWWSCKKRDEWFDQLRVSRSLALGVYPLIIL